MGFRFAASLAHNTEQGSDYKGKNFAMAAMIQMRNALMRCGLNQATSDYMMDEQGFDSTEELLMSSKESFDTMVKNAIKSAPADVTFSSASIRRLNAFK